MSEGDHYIDFDSGDVLPKGMPTSEKTKDPTYLNKRLAELGVTPEQNLYTDPEGRNMPLFDCDEVGNINILYLGLNGKQIHWKKPNTKWPRPFVRTRLHIPPADKPQQKYSQEQGSGLWPYFPTQVVAKYLEGTPIQTLFVVEGEFKAYKAATLGVDIIGVMGIQGFYNGDVKGKIHEYIQELLVKCQVERIVFIYDADLLTIKWAADKDLSHRPSNFFDSIKAFRDSLQLLIDSPNSKLQNVCVMHLLTKFVNEAKGLDDLLCKYTAVTSEIIHDLHQYQMASKYFSGKLINDPIKDMGKVKFYLGLTSEQDFYKTYEDFIGPREFLFRGKRFEYNPEKKEVQFVRHEDADKYLRIGIDWLKVIKVPNKYGKLEEKMKPWSIGEIQRDYKWGKNADQFISQLLRFDDFCNEPNWNGQYKRVHNGCYNLCTPLSWDKSPGSIRETIKLLKHIFQGSATIDLNENGYVEKENHIIGDQFSVIIDWLTILLTNPKQMLPVPVLVSKENGTGKSTFLKWLQQIFENNMVILGNDQFKMKFNGHYITKQIIAIDEGFLDVDKKAEKERLKQLVTSDRQFMELKGINLVEFNYYGKVIICSNDADNVMKIEEGESRWFIIKVPVVPNVNKTGAEILKQWEKSGLNQIQLCEILKIKSETDPTKYSDAIHAERSYSVPSMDPDLEEKLRLEVPAFLDFIFNREVFHPRISRLWFHPDWFITEQMKLIVEQTKNRTDRVFEAWIKEQFLLFRLPVLRYPLSYLSKVFNDPEVSKYRIDAIELKKYLTDKRRLKPEPTQRIKIPTAWKDTVQSDEQGNVTSFNENEITYTSVIARPYKFEAEDWLDASEISSPLISNPSTDLPF